MNFLCKTHYVLLHVLFAIAEIIIHVNAIESYRLRDRWANRHTDRHDRNYIPRRFAGGKKEENRIHLLALIAKSNYKTVQPIGPSLKASKPNE